MTRFSITLLSGVAFLAIGTAKAVQVSELGISPGHAVSVSITGFYTGGVLAGINKLVVDGTAMNGFCIDPFHFSLSTSSGYQYVALDHAPKAPGTMNSTQAREISKLWGMMYSPSMTADNAAGMQVAIWEIVGGSHFSITGNDYGAATIMNHLAGFSGPRAHLTALSGPGQDYVVCDPHASVPDSGSTASIMLVGLGAVALLRFSVLRGKGLPASAAL
jgi:hypothetical protein